MRYKTVQDRQETSTRKLTAHPGIFDGSFQGRFMAATKYVE